MSRTYIKRMLQNFNLMIHDGALCCPVGFQKYGLYSLKTHGLARMLILLHTKIMCIMIL